MRFRVKKEATNVLDAYLNLLKHGIVEKATVIAQEENPHEVVVTYVTEEHIRQAIENIFNQPKLA